MIKIGSDGRILCKLMLYHIPINICIYFFFVICPLYLIAFTAVQNGSCKLVWSGRFELCRVGPGVWYSIWLTAYGMYLSLLLNYLFRKVFYDVLHLCHWAYNKFTVNILRTRLKSWNKNEQKIMHKIRAKNHII